MKLLIRPKKSKISGVCHAIAEYFNIDPTLIRILFVGLFFTTIPIVIIYILLWIFIPKEK